jgi:hypothetical protein
MPAEPGHYRTPLRSRKAVAECLASLSGYHPTCGQRGRNYLGFNAGCHVGRFGYGHLIEVRRRGCY